MTRLRFILILLCIVLVSLAAGCRHDIEEIPPETAPSAPEDVPDDAGSGVVTLVRSECSIYTFTFTIYFNHIRTYIRTFSA